MSPSRDEWQRLGEMLEGRRVDLDLRYRNLSLFAQERGIDYRLAWDIEHARRTNYRRPTLRAIEAAYALVSGAIDSALDGGTLPVLPADTAEDPGAVLERSLARLGLSDEQIEAFARLSPEQKRGAAALAEQMRANHTNGDSKRKRA
jgi:hypothetical protein